MPVDDDTDIDEFELLKSIATSKGFRDRNSGSGRIKTGKASRYLPIYKHPLPVSEYRYNHENNLKFCLSCKVEHQGEANNC